eukprot:m.60198 g.60198  ORF g.60198 m.60198 type:complete len:67 (+) comp17419_c0_seq1:258-458(+)
MSPSASLSHQSALTHTRHNQRSPACDGGCVAMFMVVVGRGEEMQSVHDEEKGDEVTTMLRLHKERK